ncbi:CYTH and CHAD domain-containing protein [Spirilliplanes yamanashiensis]|uniref:CHAD domain-containing protein n=1 Tax=Spirilliplanes yamanashiensis TaxID=42233 RepID=A0A8J3YAL4_9ACTN|nr:CYTH and CHAD domain-containing protein [Spirilliplanes yamanashiensis]MDP9816062.1 CHAD domain-containing protein [Spirilliplanes yamanashiensis]GIJ04322.1 CHAD domain-containing protein [Spirilliplanes yamanashiensis]
METAIESERKYDVPADFALPAVDGTGEPATHELEATYFDTPDLRLAAHRITLRRRTGGTDAGWHLKTPGDGAARVEHRLPLDRSADGVPAELLAPVRAVVRRQEVAPVARLRTRRVETPVRDAAGRTLALIADDTVDAEAYGEAQHWREVEVELVEGGPEVLEAVERALLAAGATPAAGPSKLGRVLGGRVPAPDRPALSARGTVAQVQRYAREQRAALVANDPGARAGDEDAVHDMRVAIRRLRSTLKTFRSVWPADRAGRLRDELKWLAGPLGAVRDAQVMRGRMDRLTGDFPAAHDRLTHGLADDLDRGRRELTEALEGDRYLTLLDELDAAVDGPPAVGAGRVRRRARKALVRADELLAEADERTGDDRDPHLHEARKAYKRARYAAEVFGKPGRRLAKALTGLQDVLGEHQDAVITGQLLREHAGRAHEAGENGFDYGVLHERQRRAGERALEGLAAARRAASRRRIRRFLG